MRDDCGATSDLASVSRDRQYRSLDAGGECSICFGPMAHDGSSVHLAQPVAHLNLAGYWVETALILRKDGTKILGSDIVHDIVRMSLCDRVRAAVERMLEGSARSQRVYWGCKVASPTTPAYVWFSGNGYGIKIPGDPEEDVVGTRPESSVRVCRNGHYFHRRCLEAWCAQAKNTCPACRGELDWDHLRAMGIACAPTEDASDMEEDASDEDDDEDEEALERVIREMEIASLELYARAARGFPDLGVVSIDVWFGAPHDFDVTVEVSPNDDGGHTIIFMRDSNQLARSDVRDLLAHLSPRERFALLAMLRLGMRRSRRELHESFESFTEDSVFYETLGNDVLLAEISRDDLDALRLVFRYWGEYHAVRQCAFDAGLGPDPDDPGAPRDHYSLLKEQDEQDAANMHLSFANLDVNVRNELGHTPLYIVAVYNRPLAVAELLAHNAQPDLGTHGGHTALFYVARDAKSEWETIARQLVAAGADVQRCLEKVPYNRHVWRARLASLL